MKLKALALLFAVLLPVANFACTCIGEQNVEAAKKQVDVVFSGTVLHSQEIELEYLKAFVEMCQRNNYELINPYKQHLMRHTVLTDVCYKGKVRGDTAIVYSGVGGGDCGFHFDEGDRYIIYGNKKTYFGTKNNNYDWPEGKGIFWTHICQQTCLWNEEEVEALED